MARHRASPPPRPASATSPRILDGAHDGRGRTPISRYRGALAEDLRIGTGETGLRGRRPIGVTRAMLLLDGAPCLVRASAATSVLAAVQAEQPARSATSRARFVHIVDSDDELDAPRQRDGPRPAAHLRTQGRAPRSCDGPRTATPSTVGSCPRIGTISPLGLARPPTSPASAASTAVRRDGARHRSGASPAR